MRLIRLDKLLCESRGVSRETARRMIRQGRAEMDGEAQKRPETKVDPAAQTVSLDGEALIWAQQRYYLLHKPLGVVTATEDAREKTVLDLFPPELRRGLVPAGRLDKDTSGLLLLSTDGDWVHRIIAPRHDVEKVYLAGTDIALTEADAAALAAGVTLRDGTKCRPAKLELLGENRCRVTVTEGKYHLVRRLLASRGARVVTLHREQIGSLRLDEGLPPGAFRALTEAEIEAVLINT